MGRILTIALIVAGVAGLGLVGWVSLHGSAPSEPAAAEAAPVPGPGPAGPRHAVLVAARPLRVGTLIKPEDLGEGQSSSVEAANDAIEDTPQAHTGLVGAIIRRSLAPGEVILRNDVMRPGDHGFLAAVLRPGMRAVTLGAGSLTSDIDLVWPGDHVDVILTQQSDTQNSARRVFGNAVLTDIRVLAVDQQLAQGASADQAPQKGARSVTLEVTADQATRLTVAVQLGKLALTVRAADQDAAAPVTATPSPTTWAGDVAPGLGSDKARAQASTIRVWQGSADVKEFQF